MNGKVKSGSGSSSFGGLGQVFSTVFSEYNKNKSKKLMMVDALIVYSIVTASIQVRIVMDQTFLYIINH